MTNSQSQSMHTRCQPPVTLLEVYVKSFLVNFSVTRLLTISKEQHYVLLKPSLANKLSQRREDNIRSHWHMELKSQPNAVIGQLLIVSSKAMISPQEWYKNCHFPYYLLFYPRHPAQAAGQAKVRSVFVLLIFYFESGEKVFFMWKLFFFLPH